MIGAILIVDDCMTKPDAPQELLARIAVAERLAALRAGFRGIATLRLAPYSFF
jgi:DNA-binding response OmpR family regulator